MYRQESLWSMHHFYCTFYKMPVTVESIVGWRGWVANSTSSTFAWGTGGLTPDIPGSNSAAVSVWEWMSKLPETAALRHWTSPLETLLFDEQPSPEGVPDVVEMGVPEGPLNGNLVHPVGLKAVTKQPKLEDLFGHEMQLPGREGHGRQQRESFFLRPISTQGAERR